MRTCGSFKFRITEVEGLLASTLVTDHVCETQFTLCLKRCNEKLLQGTGLVSIGN